MTDDGVSYNYLLAAGGQHLQTMDERVSENDDSALGHMQPLSPSLPHLNDIPFSPQIQLVNINAGSNEAVY